MFDSKRLPAAHPGSKGVRTRSAAATAVARAVVVLLCLAPAACGAASDAEPPRHLERLDGEWTLELRLLHPSIATVDPAELDPVRGSVVLVENRDNRTAAGVPGVPTHYGTYAADLRPFRLATRGRVPTVTARLGGADSVEIAFDPGEGTGFSAAGIVAGDSLYGRWWYGRGRASGSGSGSFVMRRP